MRGYELVGEFMRAMHGNGESPEVIGEAAFLGGHEVGEGVVRFRVATGFPLLLAQGVAAFRRWFPRRSPPAQAMKAALGEALGGWV